MAERATADRVAADMKPPNYRGAVQRLRSIKPKKERIAGINGEISGIYDTVEGFKVNKKAAKIFMALDGLEADEQSDIFRSLTGLIDAAGWQKGDLVDQAEGAAPGNIVTPNFGGRRAAADAGESGDAGGEDLDEVLAGVEQPETGGDGEGGGAPSAEEQERRDAEFDAAAPKPETPAQKRARIKAAHAEGKAPDAAPPAETYTGDNSDLNPK
jgi:hypothetical protein